MGHALERGEKFVKIALIESDGKFNEPMAFTRTLELIMVALWNRADHYIFCPVVSFFLSFFFSSPNLSGRRLDVYHTSTHDVALVRI